MTIEDLYLFVSWVDSFLSLHLHHILHSSSFLIQMLRWIRGSSRIEFFIFLITWGIFFGWWELDLQLLPSSFLLLLVELLLVCALPRVCWKQSLPSSTHSSKEWIPWSWEAIQGGYHHFCIFHFFFYCFNLFFDLRALVKYDCMFSAF